MPGCICGGGRELPGKLILITRRAILSYYPPLYKDGLYTFAAKRTGLAGCVSVVLVAERERSRGSA
jgi:hypothetical protein